MTDQHAKQLIGGAVVAGLLSVVASMVVGANPISFLAGGLVVLALIGIAAWLAYRRGRRWFAYGLLGGYGVLTLMSGGQCTLLLEPTIEGSLVGFFGYPLLLVIAIVVAAVVSVIRRRRRKGDQP